LHKDLKQTIEKDKKMTNNGINDIFTQPVQAGAKIIF